jgi:magnesium-transporting ATPase (P-type)
MRLFFCGLMVVATFVFVLFLISWLFPQGAGWPGLCVGVTCLYASVFMAWALFGNQTDKTTHSTKGETTRTHHLRDNLLYFAVAMAVVTLVMAVTIHDTERNIHRSSKNDWFVGLGSACFALGYATKAFWKSRRDWRLWAITAALFVLFVAITLPVLSKMEKVPLLLMGPLTNIELLLAILLLDWIVPGTPNRSS